MERGEIKLKAKEDIRGKVWTCFMPFLVVYGIQLLISAMTAEKTYGSISIIINIGMYPLTVGLAFIYLGISDRNYNIGFGKLFEGYKNFKRLGAIFLSYIVSALYIIGGLILFIVPGILFAIRFSVLPFVLADYPEMSASEALAKCKEITDGKKGDLFIFFVSFLGWFMLCIFVIPIVYVAPYYYASLANYYYYLNPKVNMGIDTVNDAVLS